MKKNSMRFVLFTMLLSVFILSNGQLSHAVDSDYDWIDNGDGTVTITGYKGSSKDVKIPDELDGKTVTNIGDEAFDFKQLKSVTLPSSLTSIGYAAFRDNPLKSITLPSSLTSIGDYAFIANKLTSITLPSSLTSIGEFAFSKNQFKNVTLPSSLSSISDFAFYYNDQLESVTVLSDSTRIGTDAFTSSKNPLDFTVYGHTPSTAQTHSADAGYQFKAIVTYNVTYDGNGNTGGNVPVDSNDYERQTSVTALDNIGQLVKTGYIFDGWNTLADGTGVDHAVNGIFQMGEADVTLYATWKVNRYTINFDSQGGSSVADIVTNTDTHISAPSDPTKADATFAGWYTDSTFTTLWDFTADKVQTNMTLYAKWTVNNPIVTIDHVHAITDIHVPVSADTASIHLPQTVGVTLSDTTTSNIPVTWDSGTPVFDGNTPGNYEFTGNLTLPMDVTNPKNLQAKVKVIVQPAGTDTEAPKWPAGNDLSITGITTTSVQLSWPTATDNIAVTSYRIYVNDVEKATIGNHEYSYVVTGLNAQTTYNFSVQANDAAGNASMALGKSASTLSPPVNPGGGGSGSSGSGNYDSEPSYARSSNNDLQELKVLLNGQALTLTPEFTREGSAYTVETEAAKVEFSLKTAHSAAKVTLDGKPFIEGQKMPLQEGTNVFELVVEAEDGTKKTYTVTIQRTPTEPVAPIIPVKPEPVEPVKPIEFSDTAGHWAEEYIQQAAALGILKGYPDGTFKPNNPLTRAQAVSIIVRALNLQTDEAAPFKDIGNYADETRAEIAAAYQFGIIKGNGGNFNPSDHITRAQIALMIQRAYEYKIETKYDAAKAPYSDFGNYDAETVNAISMLNELNIATGSEGKFNPSDSTTRAHAAKMLVNLLNSLK